MLKRLLLIVILSLIGISFILLFSFRPIIEELCDLDYQKSRLTQDGLILNINMGLVDAHAIHNMGDACRAIEILSDTLDMYSPKGRAEVFVINLNAGIIKDVGVNRAVAASTDINRKVIDIDIYAKDLPRVLHHEIFHLLQTEDIDGWDNTVVDTEYATLSHRENAAETWSYIMTGRETKSLANSMLIVEQYKWAIREGVYDEIKQRSVNEDR